MTTVDVLLLDVMGTLVYDPFHEEMPSFFGMTLPELLEAKHPDAWVRFEHGELSEDEFLASFFADGRSYDGRAFVEHVRLSYRYLEGIEPLLRELSEQSVPMYALSNYSCWYRLIEERLELSRYVEWGFVSCETGLRKPAGEAYRHAAEALNVPPERCLFVDDRPSNCEGARRVGMQVILFEDAEQLRRELMRRGLL